MISKKEYIANFSFLISDYGFKQNRVTLEDCFEAVQFIATNREIHLVFDTSDSLRRICLLNTEEKTPGYKDSDLCYTSDMLDLISGTSERNADIFFGKNRPDGIYTMSKEQTLQDFRDLLIDNIELVQGLRWIRKSELDELYSEKMGYEARIGWKPDVCLEKLKDDLFFLLNEGFDLIQDDDALPEYNSFQWEKHLVYENKFQGTQLDIMIDYRGTCNLMRFVVDGESSSFVEYNLDVITRKLLNSNQ